MARVNTVQKSRKEKVCGRCGKTIPVGSKYFYVDFCSGRTAVRCESCGFKRSETTENYYLQSVYGLQEDYEERLHNSTGEDLEDIKNDLVSDLENLRDECQERFDNIPEQLQDGDAGQLLQERIDSLDEVASDVDSTYVQNFEDWREENGYGEDDFESWCEENGYCDDDSEDEDIDEDTDLEETEESDSNLEEHRDEFDTEATDKYKEDYLDNVVEEILGYLDNIAE